MSSRWGYLALVLLVCTATSSVAAPLQLNRITPAGDDVPRGRQIVFQFDRAVVPIGRMAREAAAIPISISPALECEWRWLNTSALACQLRDADAMTLATRYTITVSPGFEAADGSRLEATVEHTFTTARPALTYTRFVNWLSPGTPLVRVSFNQPVTLASVEQALVFATGNGAIPLVAWPDNVQRRVPWWALATLPPAQQTADDETEPGPRRSWVVEPVAELPLGASASLDIRPGLVGREGPEHGVERRTVVTFDTYPAFRFLGLRCTPKGSGQAQNILFDEIARSDERSRRCAPLKPVALLFSAPVLNSGVQRHIAFAPALDGGRDNFDPWQNVHDWTALGAPHRRGRIYERWLPTRLLADRAYTVTIDQDRFTDEFGRRLNAPVTFGFATSHREPNLKLATRNAVLEAGIDSDVPLYVTNLDRVGVRYDRLGSANSAAHLSEQLRVDKATDIAYAKPLELRRLLGQSSGAVYARLRPEPVPPNWHHDPELLAQVTPYQVHYKLGHFNSLAWVTTFASGEPVAGASVSLWRGTRTALASLEPLEVSARTNADGLARLPGLATLDPELALVYGRDNVHLFVRVEKDDDIALLPVNYDYAVRGGGVYSQLRRRGGHTHAWGTTAQGVYKLGDAIEYKIYVRDQSNRHWVAPSANRYNLTVSDPQGKTVHEARDVRLNRFGAMDGRFGVPKSAAVGWYRFRLSPAAGADDESARFTWQPLSVLVSDFTPSPFKVATELNGAEFAAGDRVRVSSLATLHAGGPFTDADVRVTARLEPRSFRTQNPLAAGFTFGSYGGRRSASRARNLADTRARLNNLGEFETQFELPHSDIYYGAVMVESAVRDDRGKFVAATATAGYAGRDHFVGLKQTRWLYQAGKPAVLETLVVDRRGRAIANAAVAVVINRREVKVARVKGPGNAYLTQNIMQWHAVASCQLRTTEAVSNCEFVPDEPGYYQFVAATLDGSGREHHTTLTGWVTGPGAVVWDQSNDATLPIIAEKSGHAVGETARFLLKNPFPGARALITVERYGVLDSWTTQLDTATPVIEVPIKPDYLPGFYLSVVVVSPRVAAPPEPGKIDLGKPSYRLGYLEATVSDPARRLKIDVSTARGTVKPRERLQARIRVSTMAQSSEPVEIAVAVVDESVLAMNREGRNYYDPYHGFNRLDNLDVNNYSLLSRLIGRQKFEKKGANPGGGGGADPAPLRNRFKFVSYWNPSIEAGPDGVAEIEFVVPDNLTGWRILALAVTPDDRMGLGDANFKVNRPTEIRPVMPNQLVAGDRVNAGFTVMNRTGSAREITVSVDVSGPLAEAEQAHVSRVLTVAPYARVPLRLPLSTSGDGTLRFTARAGDDFDTDAIEHVLRVRKRRSLETAANYGSTTASTTSEVFAIPDAVHTDVGRIDAVLSPSVIGSLYGAFNYLKDYPHLCWEQRLTKAVAASSYLELNDYLGRTVDWPAAQADVVRALKAAADFQAPNGGMAYWQATNEHVSPYLSAYTAIAFNWLRRDGHAVPEAVEQALHEYLLGLLRRDAFPSFYRRGMSASVRAVALAALAARGRLNVADVSRYERHVDDMDLFGKAHFLRAAIAVPGAPARLRADTLTKILAHANQSGGKLQFNETLDDGYQHLLASPLRSNCAVLSSLVDTAAHSSGDRSTDDMPFKLVRAITQSRGGRAHFENTQENVFCLNAFVDYANRYESERPDMRITVALNEEPVGTTRFAAFADAAVTIGRTLRDRDPGTGATLTIDKAGPGRLYYSARIAYDLEQDSSERVNAGIEVRREYSVERNGRFVPLSDPMRIARGELVRVDLFVSAAGARHFVVVDDPIPGGLEPVDTNLATSSSVDTAKGDRRLPAGSWFYQHDSWTGYGQYFSSFYHRELRFEAARFYADYLPPGNYHLSYTAQAIAGGEFSVMPVHAGEMYDPDVYGKGLPATLRVEE